MNNEQNEKRFLALLDEVKREGIAELVNYIKKSDFFTAPSSTRFHLSVEGGLLQHSLDVFDAIMERLEPEDFDNSLPANKKYYNYVVACQPLERVTREEIIVMTLLHDICKTYFYVTEKKNRKKKDPKTGEFVKKANGTDTWEEYLGYTVNDKMPLGHGEKSCFIIEEYMKLTKIERYAIRWHMGNYEDGQSMSFQAAMNLHPIVLAIHTADMEASHFMEDTEGLFPMFEGPIA